MAQNRIPVSPTAAKKALLVSRGASPAKEVSQDLLQERVLSVWVNGRLSLKMVCTPTDMKEMILGHLLSEGMVTEASQVRNMIVCEETFSAQVELAPCGSAPADPLEIRACDCGANGILGRAEIDGWQQAPGDAGFVWKPEDIFLLADAFREQTPIYRKTRGIHSCLLMYHGEIRCCCEDIGRHNALDKVIGHALADGLDLKQCIVYSSGRIPEDMIAKVIRTGIPVLASKATPTSRAVDLARRYHVTLICSAHPDSMKIFSCPELWDLPVTAGILAGGSSSRMGTNKVLLDSCGETFLEHIQKQCAFLPETILSMGYPHQIPHGTLPCVMDEKQNYGPLEGIYQILKAAKHSFVLILAADMQCLDEAFLKTFLAQLRPEDDCMVLKSANGLEPLCSVYSKSLLNVLEEMRQQDLRRPRMLFDRVNTHYVTAEDLGLTEDGLLFHVNNINTPEDYREYLKHHQQGG